MLNEEVAKYRELSGDTNPNTPISRIGGYLDGYEKALEQEPCEMTAEEYRQRMIQAFHNADTDELIAVCVLPTEKEFEHLEWLLKNHYKKEPCEDAISRQAVLDTIGNVPDHDDGMVWEALSHAQRDVALLPPVNPTKTGHCKDCKWWKDSDGTYCRGVHAESKCPINRKEVYEGNGYCYMFEPKERSDKK